MTCWNIRWNPNISFKWGGGGGRGGRGRGKGRKGKGEGGLLAFPRNTTPLTPEILS